MIDSREILLLVVLSLPESELSRESWKDIFESEMTQWIGSSLFRKLPIKQLEPCKQPEAPTVATLHAVDDADDLIHRKLLHR